MRLWIGAAAAACMLTLAACHAGAAGKSDTYQAGYASGCRAGQVNAGRPGPMPWRDDALYRSDAQYTAGWDDGAKQCYAAEVSSPHAWGGGGGR